MRLLDSILKRLDILVEENIQDFISLALKMTKVLQSESQRLSNGQYTHLIANKISPILMILEIMLRYKNDKSKLIKYLIDFKRALKDLDNTFKDHTDIRNKIKTQYYIDGFTVFIDNMETILK